MTTYTITFTQYNCTTIMSGLTKDYAEKEKSKLSKQGIKVKMSPPLERITGNIK